MTIKMLLSGLLWSNMYTGFPGGSVVNNLPAGDMGSIPKSGRSLGKGNSHPLQYSCLGLPGKSHGQRNLAGYNPWGCEGVGHDLATKQQQICIH